MGEYLYLQLYMYINKLYIAHKNKTKMAFEKVCGFNIFFTAIKMF